MENWFSILLAVALLVISAIGKSKKEKEKAARREAAKTPVFTPIPEEDIYEYPMKKNRETLFGDDPFEGWGKEEIIEEPSAEISEEAVRTTSAPEPLPVVLQEPIEEETIHIKKIDVQKLIIYSELLKPKFKEI